MGAYKNANIVSDNMLQKHIAKKHVVKICRTFRYTENNIFGYLLAISSKFLLVQVQYDFIIDGYAIMPKSSFDSIRFNKYDKELTKILVSEGSEQSWGIAYEIDLTDWRAIFTCLKNMDIHVTIDQEYLKDAPFLIGPITDVRKNSLSVKNYDATSRLNKTSTKVKYEDITMIKFGDKYTKTFRKYLKPPKQKRKKI